MYFLVSNYLPDFSFFFSEKSTKVIIELLSTYTEDNASQARDDAHRYIDRIQFLIDW